MQIDPDKLPAVILIHKGPPLVVEVTPPAFAGDVTRSGGPAPSSHQVAGESPGGSRGGFRLIGADVSFPAVVAQRRWRQADIHRLVTADDGSARTAGSWPGVGLPASRVPSRAIGCPRAAVLPSARCGGGEAWPRRPGLSGTVRRARSDFGSLVGHGFTQSTDLGAVFVEVLRIFPVLGSRTWMCRIRAPAS